MAAGVACCPCRRFRLSSRQCQQAQWKSRRGFTNKRHTSWDAYDPNWKISWFRWRWHGLSWQCWCRCANVWHCQCHCQWCLPLAEEALEHAQVCSVWQQTECNTRLKTVPKRRRDPTSFPGSVHILISAVLRWPGGLNLQSSPTWSLTYYKQLWQRFTSKFGTEDLQAARSRWQFDKA